ncbi:MAG: Rdx family protein [Actinobacteria bacterium]|nr:Rdx family protein [Actinomycetota bacterium]
MSAANDLLTNYQHVIDDLTLVMGSKGIYDIEVDGDMLYSKQKTGRHANTGEVLQLFESRYGAGVERYGN